MEKSIKGYNNYTISDEGDVFSTKYKQKRKLKPRDNGKGYLYVNLSSNGKYKSITIHKIVANTFIPNPKNLPQVNHIDGNKKNNRVDNLEWCTKSENLKHAFKMGLLKLKFEEGHHSSKLTKKDVLEIRRRFKENPKINRANLAREFNVAHGTIRGIIFGKTWKKVI